MATLATTNSTITTAHEYTAADVVAAFIDDVDASAQTRKSYAYNLKAFVAWLEENDLAINHVAPKDVRAYKRYLMETRKPSTVNAYLTSVRALYKWIEVETGYRNPATSINGVRGVNKGGASMAHDALTHKQAVAVATHEGKGIAGMRDRAMVNLMLVCALRTVEVVRLNVEDYRAMGSKRVIAIQGKGHATADVVKVVPDSTAELLDAYLMARGDVAGDAPLFASTSNRNQGGRMTTRAVNGIVKNTMRAEGIDSPKLTAHSLRHSAITFVVEGGTDLLDAQRYARHADPRTTEIYLHLQDDLKGACEDYVAQSIAG